MVFSNNLLMGAGGQASGYEIEQSCRYNDGDSPYLNRSFGTPTSAANFGYSFWVKLGAGYNGSYIISADGSGNNDNFYFNSNQINIQEGGTPRLVSDQVFRDHAAWYHFVVAYELGNSTNAHKLRVYLNGSEITSWSTDARSGLSSTSSRLNANGVSHDIGANVNNGASTHVNNFDGYLAEFHFVDGTVITPSMFGETNSDGVWVPIKANPTYGNNGFYLAFQDSSALGDDTSGEGNDWSSSGLAAADQVTDSPTNNMPTLNPLSNGTGALSDGNLQYTGVSGNWSNSRLTLLVPETGKWAIRMKSASSYQQIIVGLCAPDNACPYTDIDVNGVVQIRYNTADGNFVTRVGGSLVNDTGPPTVAAQTFFQLLFDMDNGKLGMAADGATSGTFADISTYSALDLNGASLSTARQPFVQAYSGTDANAGVIIDVGQSGWETTVTGFKNLTLANLAAPTIADPSKYFQTTLYNGTGSELEVDQSGENSTFQPDFAWIKNRTNAGNEHDLYDAVRGATKAIFSSSTNAESTQTQGLKSFDGDGFTVGTRGEVNTSGSTNVAWQWLAGNTTGSTNDDGSVDSTVTANTTAGFSICKFNPGGNSNITFGQGLGVAPRLVLVKNLEDATNWQVLHVDQGVGNKIFLNTTAAAASDANMWQNTAPTSSVVSVGTSQTTNEQNIAYCFAEISGYNKIRGYTGNGNADGPFVYTGFSPQFILFRCTSAVDAWQIYDTKRYTFNAQGRTLAPNSNAAESSFSARLDILSNGFKLRTTNTALNGSSETYIYIAFAEHPFGGDGIASATAR